MELSGLDNDRKYFKEDITPDQIRKAGDAEIKLVAVLPQDDQTRMAMAQMAREGPTPLIDDRNIREMYLALQDPDRIEDAVKEQMGERMLPEAALLSILNAMINSGKQEEAWFYYMQLTQLLAEKYGYELDLIPIDWPGIEQTAAWLQMRRNKPDWAFLWGWGASNQVAIKSATLINFPMDHFIGVWWSGSESDVVPTGQFAKGTTSARFSTTAPALGRFSTPKRSSPHTRSTAIAA